MDSHSQPQFNDKPQHQSQIDSFQKYFEKIMEFQTQQMKQIEERKNQVFKELKDDINKIKISYSSPLPPQIVPNPNSKPSSSYGKAVRFIEPSPASSSQPSSSSQTPSFSAHGITLRSGKEMEEPSLPPVGEDDSTSDSTNNSDTPSSPHVPIPFLEAFNKRKKKPSPDSSNLEELFKQIVIHLPLFKALEHIPSYVKFLKQKMYTIS